MDLTGMRRRYSEALSYTSLGDYGVLYPWVNGEIVAQPYKRPRVGSWNGERREIYESIHSDFRQRRRRGEVMFGNLLRTVSTRTSSPRSLTIGPIYNGWNGWTQTYYGDDCSWAISQASGSVNTLSSDLERIKDLVLVKAYSNLNSGCVSFAENAKDIGSTIKMFRKPFSSAQDLLRRMAKHRSRYSEKTTTQIRKAAANTWLEYRYGWRPVVGDMQALYKELRNKPTFQPHYVVRSGLSDSRNSSQIINSPGIPVEIHTWNLSGSVRTEEKVRASSGIMYRLVSGASRNDISRILSTRAQDIPSVVWECMPYSFVVDWFVGVGDFITAVTPNPSVSILGTWVTTVVEKTVTYEGTVTSSTPSNPPTRSTGSYGSSVEKTVVVQRECNRSLPSLPVAKLNPLALGQYTDAAALGSQILSKIRAFSH